MTTENNETNAPSKGTVTSLAMIGGLGMTLMVLAPAIGVLGVDAAAQDSLALVFFAGAGLMVAAILAWIFAVQPHKHFDDINQPAEPEHH